MAVGLCGEINVSRQSPSDMYNGPIHSMSRRSPNGLSESRTSFTACFQLQQGMGAIPAGLACSLAALLSRNLIHILGHAIKGPIKKRPCPPSADCLKREVMVVGSSDGRGFGESGKNIGLDTEPSAEEDGTIDRARIFTSSWASQPPIAVDEHDPA